MVVAVVIKDVKNKIRLINDESVFYKTVIDKYNRIKNNHLSLVPVMTHMAVTGHFGELLATEFATKLYKLKTVEAGVVQSNIIRSAQEIGIIPKELIVKENPKFNYRRRVDITMFEEDDTVHKFESKATSIVANYKNKTETIHVFNLKEDVPRLLLTVFDWNCLPPRASILYIPNHTRLGKTRKDFTLLVVEDKTFDKIIQKLKNMDPEIIVQEIDLLDNKYSIIIQEIVKISKLEDNIEDTPINITKSAVEKIVAAQFNLTLTENVRSKYDLTDENGRKYEVKNGTIAPVCDRHALQAVISKIKPDFHDELIACLYLPLEDILIIIKDFESKAGTISFTGATLKILLASFATKSGSKDKNKLLLDIYKELGDVERIEQDLYKLIEDNKRDDSVKRHLESARTAKKEELAKDPEKMAKHVENKHMNAAQCRKGFTQKIKKLADTTPVIVPEGKTEAEVRKELLESLAETEMKNRRAKKATYERERLARKKNEI